MMRPRLLHGLALAAALGVLIPRPATGRDDGGTESIFANGTGVRAVALGGAYAALASDASAMAWNPGGLGLVSRREFQAGRFQYGYDAHEEYLAFALPSWRWGGLGVSYRSFGVGGIEQRDDRNTLLASDLTSTESELAIGFGRSLGGAWSVGGAAKIQSQNVAGASGSGLGLDAGMTVQPLLAAGVAVPWADRVSFGLAVRNLIEPSIRLDEASVPDPSVVRTGLAYRSRWTATALEIEHPHGVGTRVRFGTEFTPHPMLSLRGGWNGRGSVFGAGVRWQSLALDYAFEDAGIATIHRIGVTLVAGRTVAENRAAALRADEERIQTRLTEAFDQIERERVDSLLARAEAARAAERYDDAFDILGAVGTLAPGEPRAADLERRCLRESAARLEGSGDYTAAALAYGRVLAKDPADSLAAAARARCRAESDRRSARSSAIRDRFAQALDAFAANDLPAARTGFLAILATQPTDQEASAMLRRTEQAIARQTDVLIREARRAIDAGRLAEADQKLDQARVLDPRADGLSVAALALTQARQLAAAQPKTAPPAPETSSTHASPSAPGHSRPTLSRRELEALYRRGLVAMEQRRPDDALRYWEIVWSADPTYARVGDYLKREYLMRGMNSFAAGKLEEAVALWERVLAVDPDDARAKGYIARAEKQLARTRELLGEGP
jgi:tetratricopeptide (TPR) repeat protein